MLVVDPTPNPSQQITEMAVLLAATGVARLFAIVALIVAAVVAVVWCVSLCFEFIVGLGTRLALLSIQSDPVVKLVMLARIIYAAVQLDCLARR